MPRAVGCFRAAGFRVKAYPVEGTNRSYPSAGFGPGAYALFDLDDAANEWIGLVPASQRRLWLNHRLLN
jgi:uncharacterized SAM-binding protein YcdF (DUF218 family)